MEALIAIKEVVENHFNIDLNDSSRQILFVDGRRMYSALARQFTGYNLSEIGRLINKEHTLVLHYIKTSDNLYSIDIEYKNNYNQILDKLPLIVDSQNVKSRYEYHLKMARKFRKIIAAHEN